MLKMLFRSLYTIRGLIFTRVEILDLLSLVHLSRPRKWNVAVVGTHDLFEHPHINDLAYMPATKDGRFGFNILVGGFFSPKRCAEAVPLDAWVSADDVIPVCKAILEAYRDLGFRGNRQKTRMMWLIDELVSNCCPNYNSTSFNMR